MSWKEVRANCGCIIEMDLSHDWESGNTSADDVSIVSMCDNHSNAALTTRLQEAEAVIKPFANEDFCVELSGNFQGDLSPVFQRVQAMLTLGDFRRAAAWLKGGTN